MMPNRRHPEPDPSARLLCAVYWPTYGTDAIAARLFAWAEASPPNSRRHLVLTELALTVDNVGVRINDHHARRVARNEQLLAPCRCGHARGAHLAGRLCLEFTCRCSRHTRPGRGGTMQRRRSPLRLVDDTVTQRPNIHP